MKTKESRFIFLCFFCICFVAPVFPAQKYPDMEVLRVISVYDGDTFRADIKGMPDIIGKNIPIRVFGVDTPEIRGVSLFYREKGYRAKDFTSTFLKSGKKIILRDAKRGKYFRIVAKVEVDGKDLGESLINKGYARRYIIDWEQNIFTSKTI